MDHERTSNFYHPTSRRVLSSQDVTFDESVPYYRLFPYRTPSLPPPPLFLVPGPPPVDPLPPQGPAPSGVSQVDAVEPVEVTGDSGAAAGAEPGGAGTGGAEPGGVEPGGAEPGGAEPGGTESGGAEPRGAEPGGTEPGDTEPRGAEPGGAEIEGAPPGGASSRREPLSPRELREWFARRWRRAARAGGSSAAEGTAATGPGVRLAVLLGLLGVLGILEVLLGVLELLEVLLEVLLERVLLLEVLLLSLLFLASPRGLDRTLFPSCSRFLVLHLLLVLLLLP
ncbi:unnamed protein product [Closterium sp. NIES-65]|nr:unnamed protein product [Closterium sp. NIES-65]